MRSIVPLIATAVALATSSAFAQDAAPPIDAQTAVEAYKRRLAVEIDRAVFAEARAAYLQQQLDKRKIEDDEKTTPREPAP